MKTPKPVTPSPRILLAFLCIATIGLLANTTAAAQDTNPPHTIDPVDSLADAMASGSRAARQVLGSIDDATRNALDQLTAGDLRHVATFSARTQIETLYNLAESSREGEGTRFLAKLHARVAPHSAIAAIDGQLQQISRRFTPAELATNLSFVDPRTLGTDALLRPLPADVRDVIDVLARVVAPNDVPMVLRLMERNFNLTNAEGQPARRIIDQSIIGSRNRRDAFSRIIAWHSAPPPIRQALQRLLVDVAANSAAFAMNERLAGALKQLAAEPLPTRLRSFTEVADNLPSRTAQRNAAPGGNASSRQLTGAAARRAAIAAFARRAPRPPASPTDTGPSYVDTQRAHANYSQRTFGANGTPRAYRLAIRSSRAARGIAIGARVEGPRDSPELALWIPSEDSAEFGRFVVKMPQADRLAASRHLFSDSFFAAVSILQDAHGPNAAFTAGEINILLSLDPDSEIGEDLREQVLLDTEKKLDALEDSSDLSADDDATALVSLFEQYLEAQEIYTQAVERMADAPRGIVIHPALHGRELAWSCARIDFWFNDLDTVSAEAALINGGNPMPPELKSLFTGEADTWQFYELDGKVTILGSPGHTDLLQLQSRVAASEIHDSPTHFAISLFTTDAPSVEATSDYNESEAVWRLVEEERDLQRTLDWLFANHHDFIRLNDFSEALSILRWLNESGRSLINLSPNSALPLIATPDRVFLRDVRPHAGPRP